MRLTAENMLLLIARKKGYVSQNNQPYFKSKRFVFVMRDFKEDGLVFSIFHRTTTEKRFALTDYGELVAAGLCMLNSCPKELTGKYKWLDLVKES
jgi:hypothetical protein